MTYRATCLAAGLAIAALVAAPSVAASKNAPKTHEVVAKVIAVDLQSKSIEAEIGTGRSRTFLVVGKAAERLDQLAIGRRFKLTFQESDNGTRHDVIAIKRAKNIRET